MGYRQPARNGKGKNGKGKTAGFSRGDCSLTIIYMVRPTGFEPVTSCSGGKRSIQLSYGRTMPVNKRA